MALYDVLDLQTRVSARLNEASGAVYYPDTEILAALNEAQRFFCLLTLALEVTTLWPILTAMTPLFHMLSIFPNWIVPLRLADVTGAKIRPSRLEDLNALNSQWLNTPTSPAMPFPARYVELGADIIGIYPQIAITGQPGTFQTVTYAAAPSALVDPTDLPQIPLEYAPRLIDYALYRLRQSEGSQEFEKGLKYLGSFMDGAQKYGKYVRSRNLGSRYDHVPFELESYDRSKLLKLRTDLVPGRKVTPI